MKCFVPFAFPYFSKPCNLLFYFLACKYIYSKDIQCVCVCLCLCLCLCVCVPWVLHGTCQGRKGDSWVQSLREPNHGVRAWGTKPGTTVPVLQQPGVVKFHPGAAPAVSSMPARVTSHPSLPGTLLLLTLSVSSIEKHLSRGQTGQLVTLPLLWWALSSFALDSVSLWASALTPHPGGNSL